MKLLRVSFLLTLFFSILSSLSFADVREYVATNEQKILQEYIKLLSIPNVATDLVNIRRNAEHIRQMLEARGVRTQLLELEGAPPAVFGELKASGARKTVAIYVHYDGQPVDAAKWESDPWKPVVREDRIYARSASDDKAPIIAIVAALDALKAEGKSPNVNLKFFFEGEEEAGSPHLEAVLQKYRDLLESDFWLFCDGPVHQSRRIQLYFGARGVIGVELTVYGPLKALHSGHYGNWAPNPIALLTDLLASMRDPNGKILIPRFYDSVRPLNETEKKALADVPDPDEELRKSLGLAWTEGDGARLAERIATLPALNFRGVLSGNVGEKAANAIPNEAHASIDFRLVPDLMPAEVRALVEQHIREKGFHIVPQVPDEETRLKHPRIIRLQWETGYPAARTSMELPASQAVIKAVENAVGGPIIKMPTLGGSIPIYLFEQILKTPVIGLPIVNHDNNQHAANENLRLQNLWDAIPIYAALFSTL